MYLKHFSPFCVRQTETNLYDLPSSKVQQTQHHKRNAMMTTNNFGETFYRN